MMVKILIRLKSPAKWDGNLTGVTDATGLTEKVPLSGDPHGKTTQGSIYHDNGKMTCPMVM